jgi:hypothetical protein
MAKSLTLKSAALAHRWLANAYQIEERLQRAVMGQRLGHIRRRLYTDAVVPVSGKTELTRTEQIIN